MTGARRGKVRLRVAAVIIRDGRLLAVEHEKGGRSYWLLPGGGVEPGERLTAALVRECSEELGVTTEPGRLALVCDSIDPSGARHIVQVAFFAQIRGEPGFTGSDARVRSVAWLDAATLREATFYPDLKGWLLEALESPRRWEAPYVAPEWK
jgi:ADP-ribose pyrophosphatase YjhB (NUDIX family)